MADLYDCSDPEARAQGLDAAAAAIGRGDLVLLPTDTVYGVAADAFAPAAVTGLLAAKNRGRTMPVPVLIGEASTLAGLVVNLPPVAYLFNKEDPNGWVHCQLNEKGATLELRALNAQHPKQGQKLELTWRT